MSSPREIPRAYALGYWPTADMSDIRRARRLSLLAEILDDRLRLKIRQELGDSYSPASYHVPSDTFTGYGYMTAMATLKPDQVAQGQAHVSRHRAGAWSPRGSRTMSSSAPVAPMLEALTKMRRDNDYWLKRVLRNCQEQPRRLDWARSLVDDVKSATRDEMVALAKQFAGEQGGGHDRASCRRQKKAAAAESPVVADQPAMRDWSPMPDRNS